MLKRHDLPDILFVAIKNMEGKANIVDVCKYFWDHYEEELRQSGNLFYTWQYDIRWAATTLRKSKRMKSKDVSPRGVWETI
ncbi:MAG: hypothetical protein PHO15_11235 [Eubacteriales bacterium]|nr:hypothetical protein [Eubacteriales bacterium]